MALSIVLVTERRSPSHSFNDASVSRSSTICCRTNGPLTCGIQVTEGVAANHMLASPRCRAADDYAVLVDLALAETDSEAESTSLRVLERVLPRCRSVATAQTQTIVVTVWVPSVPVHVVHLAVCRQTRGALRGVVPRGGGTASDGAAVGGSRAR